MRLVFLLVTMLYSHYYGISQSNLPDWILARPSHPNVGYIANVVIPASWPLGPFGDIYVQIPSSNGDSQDNIIIEAYDNQIPKYYICLRNLWRKSKHWFRSNA